MIFIIHAYLSFFQRYAIIKRIAVPSKISFLFSNLSGVIIGSPSPIPPSFKSEAIEKNHN